MSTGLFLGPLEIGVLVSSVVYGVTCLQCYLYFFEHSSKDSPLLKLFVAVLMTLETFHAILLAHALYIYSVKNFGNVNKLSEMIWSLLFQILIATILSTATQFFFAFRIYRLSNRRRYLIPTVVCILGLTTLGFSICFVVDGFKSPSSPYLKSAGNIFPWLGGGVTLLPILCDSLITTTTIQLLRVQSNQSPLARTGRMINKLIKYTLASGLLTAIFSLITGIIVLVYNDSLVFIPFYFLSTRLYICSLISILNSRDAVQKELSGDLGTTDAGTTNSTGNDPIFTTVGFELTQMGCAATIDNASQLYIYQESNDIKSSGLGIN